LIEFIVKPIEGLNGSVQICKLQIDGECEFDEFVSELTKSKRGQALLDSILQNLEYVALGKRLPETKFRQLKREKGDEIPDYEVKKVSKLKTVRVYLFKDSDNRIIAVVGSKKTQDKDILRLRRIKAEYYEQKK
jgi:hypothetical protein